MVSHPLKAWEYPIIESLWIPVNDPLPKLFEGPGLLNQETNQI